MDQEHLVAFAKATNMCVINTVDEFLADPARTGTFVLKSEEFPIRSDFILTNRTAGVVSQSVS